MTNMCEIKFCRISHFFPYIFPFVVTRQLLLDNKKTWFFTVLPFHILSIYKLAGIFIFTHLEISNRWIENEQDNNPSFQTS